MAVSAPVVSERLAELRRLCSRLKGAPTLRGAEVPASLSQRCAGSTVWLHCVAPLWGSNVAPGPADAEDKLTQTIRPRGYLTGWLDIAGACLVRHQAGYSWLLTSFSSLYLAVRVCTWDEAIKARASMRISPILYLHPPT